MKSIDYSIKQVRERIYKACERSGRPQEEVKIVGASKGVELDRIRYAFQCGITDFGENYVQEARKKIEACDFKAVWHMIGHIQQNKIKYIPRLFDYVHSVDRFEVLEGLERFGKPMRVLFELNLAGEETKHGTDEKGLKGMLERIRELKYIEPIGLMTMPPFDADPAYLRKIFRRLKTILEEVNSEFGLNMGELSMGMSNDFEIAVEEGATMVRIGTAIFGERL
ncbi:MAG: YggS family pyridoxal phosphate-dependent enzyme [Syntrophorhabdaceae bacterium]|nr:YggS family pyridoxal phosphate-dependent enzyme [Syntrophorhabdaceae bacterium]